jgi:uncharacterized protein (DUF779 family)
VRGQGPTADLHGDERASTHDHARDRAIASHGSYEEPCGDSSLCEAPLTPGRRPRTRVVITDAARQVVSRIRGDGRRQALMLSWPSSATMTPVMSSRPGEFDVIIGHVQECPIYLDLRQVALFAHGDVVLDVDHVSAWRTISARRARPALQLRLFGGSETRGAPPSCSARGH